MEENTATQATPETGYSEDDAAAELLSRWSGKQEEKPADPEATEPEAPPSEDAEPTAEQGDEPQADADGKAPETEWEVEFGGQTRKLKGVSEEVAREVQEFGKNLHADYTRKTQELAEVRKTAEAEREQAQEMLKLSHEHADLFADFRTVQRQMDQLAQLDFDALSEADPMTAQKQLARLMQLQQAQQRIGAQLQTSMQTMTQKQSEAAKAKLADAEAQVRKAIPTWGKETAQALRDYGQSLGYNEAELSQVADPRMVLLLHKARQFDALQQAKPALTKKVSEISKTLKTSATAAPNAQKRARVDDAMARLGKSGSIADAAAAILAKSKTR